VCDENGLAVFELIRRHGALASAVHCAFDLLELIQHSLDNVWLDAPDLPTSADLASTSRMERLFSLRFRPSRQPARQCLTFEIPTA